MKLGEFVKQHSDGIDSISIEYGGREYESPIWNHWRQEEGEPAAFVIWYCSNPQCEPCNRRRPKALQDFSVLETDGVEISQGEWRSLDGLTSAWSWYYRHRMWEPDPTHPTLNEEEQGVG